MSPERLARTSPPNVPVWCLHNETRYVFVPTEGPVIMWEYQSCRHLSEGLPTVDEVRPTRPFFYFATGPRYKEKASL